jgi:hypothetical protein
MLAAIERIDMLLVDAFPHPARKPALPRAQRQEDALRVPEGPSRLARPVAPTKVVLLEHYGLPEKGEASEPVAQEEERVVGLD